MSAPVIPDNCPQCEAGKAASDYAGAYRCGTLVSSSGRFYHTVTCRSFSELRKPIDQERDQLAERVREHEAWKESALAVEREWDPDKLAAMLGGQPGESQRAVIQRGVPKLLERVKRLEEAGDKLIDAIQSVQCWNGTYVGDCVDEFESAKGNQ